MEFRFNFDFKESTTTADDDVTNVVGSSPKFACERKSPLAEYKSFSLRDVMRVWRENRDMMTYSVERLSVGDVAIRYVQPIQVDPDLENTDLIPSVYEGGLKIWECSLDLSRHLADVNMRGKRVLELGCGVGVPGIMAAHLGAGAVTFQDYNESVLTAVTGPGVVLFLDRDGDDDVVTDLPFDDARFRFVAGDWSKMKCVDEYDVIVTSETIYDTRNYSALHDAMRRSLSRGGLVLVAAKSFYFGVGGGVDAWIEFVRRRAHFVVDQVRTIDAPVQRKILRMRVAPEQSIFE